jgi:hypothetical protein
MFAKAHGKANVTSLIERQSRFTLLLPNADRRSAGVIGGIRAALDALPPAARRTITFDRGTEFMAYPRLAAELGVRSYFCDPHSPWQKGAVENNNGRLRRLPDTARGVHPTDDAPALRTLRSRPAVALHLEPAGAKVRMSALSKVEGSGFLATGMAWRLGVGDLELGDRAVGDEIENMPDQHQPTDNDDGARLRMAHPAAPEFSRIARGPLTAKPGARVNAERFSRPSHHRVRS